MEITNPTIVVIAYNRPDALSRVLRSVLNSNYHGYKNIRLVISIDGGGDKYKEVRQVAQSCIWEYGPIEIIDYFENKGLRKHVIACGDLSYKYENLIVLEDDCFVSLNYYDYAVKALTYYISNKKIAGISLYSYNYYESFGASFMPIKDGFDNYFLQAPSSWGQIWTSEQWRGFKEYYDANPVIKATDKIPEKVKTWPESSWKKYFYNYMVQKKLFFVYPHISLSTNFGEVGTHVAKNTQIHQVVIENYCYPKKYCFSRLEDSKNIYDAYFEILPACLISRGLNIDLGTCIDTNGSKPLTLFNNKFVLSNKACTQPIKSYDNVMIPIIQNIFYNIKGNVIHYALRENFGELLPETKQLQIANAQILGYSTGIIQVKTERYYKIGYYLLHPIKILGLIKRKLKK